MMAKPDPQRIYWLIGKAGGPYGPMVNSDYAPSAWPKPEEVHCWCFEGQRWRRDAPAYPKERK